MAGGSLRRFFDERFVRNYDTWMKPIERRTFEAARTRLLPRANGRVLEIGAGTGANFRFYGDGVRYVVATDPEPRMLTQSRVRAAQGRVPIHLAVASAERLPFAPATFDSVVATLVFCTIPDPERAFAEVARVLVPGGRLILLEHVRSSTWLLALAQDVANPIQNVVAAGCNLNRPTQALANRSGFHVTSLNKRFLGVVVEMEATVDART